MYRPLVLLVVLAAAECHGNGDGNIPWYKHNHSHGFGDHHHHHDFGGGHHHYGGGHHHFGGGHRHFGGPGHHHPGGENHGANGPPDNFPGSTFEDIGKNMNLIDKALKKFCDDNNKNITSELYGQENYILKYYLPGFKESDLEVKIMNRLIYTTANSEDSNLEAFKDLRILPSAIDTSKAGWVYEHKTLKIYIPYTTNTLNEKVLYCDGVDEASTTVPNKKFNAPMFNYRMKSND